MLKATLYIACAALVLSLIALFRPATPIARGDAPAVDDWKAERNYPPLVFNSTATLDCSISSTANGRQLMHTISGQGFDFDATMLPIKDGKLRVENPGMNYKFT